ncbi:hypothetical protein FB45DRAFT_1039375 [Roridomyces roridus]|uniref:Uncharacterized protein n=1 Tax=Roridomyces roridus TaxID=1738132 RepID=A0AAD7B2D0_9AGAR|nr:hypothetical protein FB45DRAFT_1039375 [Roridomyces roridus]
MADSDTDHVQAEPPTSDERGATHWTFLQHGGCGFARSQSGRLHSHCLAQPWEDGQYLSRVDAPSLSTETVLSTTFASRVSYLPLPWTSHARAPRLLARDTQTPPFFLRHPKASSPCWKPAPVPEYDKTVHACLAAFSNSLNNPIILHAK